MAMYRRPWYVQAADAAHRLTVLGIIGFSVYLAGGIGMTLWANRSSAREQRLLEQSQQQQQQQQQGQSQQSDESKSESS